MKGLLLKDWYMAKKYFRTYLVLALLFVAASCVNGENLFFAFYPCLICGMLPVNLLGYDERSKWDVYSAALPCTRDQVVSAKYLIGLLAGLAVIVLTAVVQAVRMLATHTFQLSDYLTLLGMLLILSCVSSSITLPFMFKLGVERGRVAYYVMVGVVCGGSVLASNLFSIGQTTVSFGVFLPLVCLAAVGVYALSWYLSILFYRNREL